MSSAWKVNTEGGALIEEFRKGKVVIGWHELGNLNQYVNQNQIRQKLDELFVQEHRSTLANWASVLEKFTRTIAKGDYAVAYDRNARVYLVGQIMSDYFHEPETSAEWPNVRLVEWSHEIRRSDLSINARNSLGSLLTVCAVRDDVWAEMLGLMEGKAVVPADVTESEDIQTVRQDLEEQARQLIADRIEKLDDRQLEHLVAGILRAMGFKTRVAPVGPDRGVDVTASPDGLGLQEPRIKVEVKHRKGQSGSQMLRSFIGVLRSGDKGLYVSTGGFTREARYEAERASIPVSLVDMDELVYLITAHYDSFDMDTKALVPLSRVYWPAE